MKLPTTRFEWLPVSFFSRRGCVAIFLVLATSSALSLAGSARADDALPPLVTPVSGQPFRGRLVKVSDDWQLSFAPEKGELRTLAAADLATWGSFVESSRGPQILLVGGGLLLAEVLEVDREQLRVDSPLAGQLKLPLELVPGVLFHPPADRARRDALVERLLTTRGETDRVILDNGDELTGTVAACHDEVLSLEAEVGKAEIEAARVAAVLFNPALARPGRSGSLRVMVGLSDGSRVLCKSLTADADHARLTLAGGVTCQVELSAIVALQPFGGRALYLSDLRPGGYKHLPFLSLNWPYHADRNAAGNLLRAGGRLALKGLGMHSAARLTYNLDGDFRRLVGEVGIDDAAGGRGSVVFRVFADEGNGQWQVRFTSTVLRGDDAPLPLDVDLAGVKRISLLVEFADRGDEQDDADWLNIRLVK